MKRPTAREHTELADDLLALAADEAGKANHAAATVAATRAAAHAQLAQALAAIETLRRA